MQLVTAPKIKDKYLLISIKQAWKSNFGGSIEKHTTDIRFRNGTLSVVVSSAPLRHELILGKDKIVRILNEALGHDHIKTVHIY